MGFLDKAKKMAEQAQTKLDEVQKQFNESQSGSSERKAPPVEYDQHGRPVPQEQPPAATTPPSAPSPPPVATTPPSAPPVPSPPPAEASTPPHGDPVEDRSAPPPSVPGAAAPVPDPAAAKEDEEDRNTSDYTPPKMSPGDPLAG